MWGNLVMLCNLVGVLSYNIGFIYVGAIYSDNIRLRDVGGTCRGCLKRTWGLTYVGAGVIYRG